MAGHDSLQRLSVEYASFQKHACLVDRLRSEACLLLFFYEILVDSTLATRRIGEQKFHVYSLLAPPTTQRQR